MGKKNKKEKKKTPLRGLYQRFYRGIVDGKCRYYRNLGIMIKCGEKWGIVGYAGATQFFSLTLTTPQIRYFSEELSRDLLQTATLNRSYTTEQRDVSLRMVYDIPYRSHGRAGFLCFLLQVGEVVPANVSDFFGIDPDNFCDRQLGRV